MSQIFLSTSHVQVEDAEGRGQTACPQRGCSPITAHPQLWECGRLVPDDAGQHSRRYRAFRSLSKPLPRNCPLNVTFQIRVLLRAWHLQAKFTLHGQGASYGPVSFASSTIQFVGAGRKRDSSSLRNLPAHEARRINDLD